MSKLLTNVIRKKFSVQICGPDGVYSRTIEAESMQAARLVAEDMAAKLAENGVGDYLVLSISAM